MRRVREQAVEVAEGERGGVFRMESIYIYKDQNCIKKKTENERE